MVSDTISGKFRYNPIHREITEGISLFTAVKNRPEALAEALPTWLSHPQINEIIIVDWGSDDSLVPLVEKFRDDRIVLAVVHEQPAWILSYAYNLAARLTSRSKLLKIDADVKVLPGFFDHHMLRPGIFYTGNWQIARDDNEKHLHGMSYMFRESFFSVNGYNEFIKSYGWDDIDLYDRLKQSGLTRFDLDHNTLCHIPHERRTSFQSHITFINQVNDTEKSLLNSLINRFISTRFKPWTTAEQQLSFRIETAGDHIVQCFQQHDDRNTVPQEVMDQCERLAMIERFYELGAGLSPTLLSTLTRNELIRLLNLHYSQWHSPDDKLLFNAIRKFHATFTDHAENARNEASDLHNQVRQTGHDLNSANQVVLHKNMLIESLTYQLDHPISTKAEPGFGAIPIFPGKVNLGDQVGAYYGSHRSGWGYAFASLEKLHNPDGILLDAFIERTFHWHPSRVEAHRHPWVGFIHVPPFVPNWFAHEVSNDAIFALPEWKESLPYCRGLFTLSHYHKRILEKTLDLPVNNLLHPTEVPDKKWSWEAFLANREKKVVQVGFWLRKLYSIHLLNAEGYTKIFLRKKDSDIDRLLGEERANCELRHLITEEAVNSVTSLEFLTNDEYDTLLTENIVFMDLYDASANNSVIECIVRNTPLLVNPLESVVEYLGSGYPLYFHDLEEASEKLCDPALILSAHRYLSTLPVKEKLTQEYFLKSVVNSPIYRNL